MPNTLAHIGIQGVVARVTMPNADFKWICLGCVIPDVPWIIERCVRFFGAAGHVDLYDLRLYAIVQSSFIACLMLSLSAALLSSSPRRICAVLALNSTVHFVLDGLETKWANGVHFFAPFSWKLWNAGLFWPESLWVMGATVWGALYFLYGWLRSSGRPVGLCLSQRRSLAGFGLLALYLALPPLFFTGPEEANNHYVNVLRHRDERPGRYMECDRCAFVQRDQVGILRTIAGEELVLLHSMGLAKGTISVRGQFVDENTVRTYQVHEHWPRVRDGASKLGLFLIGVLWLAWLRRSMGWRATL